MVQLDELLAKAPDEKSVAQLAELRIRNLQAFAELQSYNDTGHFINRHPLLSSRSEFAELESLFRRDPAEFLRRHKNVLDSIRRYKSYLKRTDRKNRRSSDRQHLEKHEERERMFKIILERHSSN